MAFLSRHWRWVGAVYLIPLGLLGCRANHTSGALEEVSPAPVVTLPSVFHDPKFQVDVNRDDPGKSVVLWVPVDGDVTAEELKAGNVWRIDAANPEPAAAHRYWSGYEGDHLLHLMAQDAATSESRPWYLPLGAKSELLVTAAKGQPPLRLNYQPGSKRFDNVVDVTIKRLDSQPAKFFIVGDLNAGKSQPSYYTGEVSDLFVPDGRGSLLQADECLSGTFSAGRLADGEASYRSFADASIATGAFVDGLKDGRHVVTFPASKNQYYFQYSKGQLTLVYPKYLIDLKSALVEQRGYRKKLDAAEDLAKPASGRDAADPSGRSKAPGTSVGDEAPAVDRSSSHPR